MAGHAQGVFPFLLGFQPNIEGHRAGYQETVMHSSVLQQFK